MWKWSVFALCVVFLACAAIQDAAAQTATNLQGQDMEQTQIMYGSSSGSSDNGGIPRSFPIPMPVPTSPQHAGYWGVITPDWTFQKVQDITRFKGVWRAPDIASLCANKVDKTKGRNMGKVLIQKSFFSNFGPSDGIAVVATEAPRNAEEMALFRRNFRQIGTISGKGEKGADSERVMGECMKEARAIGTILMVAANEGAQLVLNSKSFYWGLGVSPSMVGGGSNSAPGASFVAGFGSGNASARYDAAPWQQWKLFARGTEEVSPLPKLWIIPQQKAKPVAKSQQQKAPGMGALKEGVQGVEKDPRYGAEAPERPLAPPIVNNR